MTLARFVAVVALGGCGRVGFDPGDGFGDGRCGLVPSPVRGTEYFIAPPGDDGSDGLTPDSAWATFEHAWSVIQPGDTLTLVDGVYRQELRPARSGTIDAPILIRASHDGGAIIDGSGVRPACSIVGPTATDRRTDIDLEGVYCENPLDTTAGGEAAVLVYHADRVRVRRVTARAFRDVVFEVADASDVLLEDVAAYGAPRAMIATLNVADVTIRRAYARWSDSASAPDPVLFSISDGIGVRIENALATIAPGAPVGGVGFAVSQVYSRSTEDTSIVGSASIGTSIGIATSRQLAGPDLLTRTTIRDVVSIASDRAVYQRGDSELTAVRLTMVGASTGFAVGPNVGYTPPHAIGFQLRDSGFVGVTTGIEVSTDPAIMSAIHHDNIFDGVTTPYAGAAVAGSNERALAPGWDTARFGQGAYFVRPLALAFEAPIGAEILHRIVDGVTTDVPLWPWPLEDRIVAEDGAGPTWEVSGGVWREPPPVRCP